MKLAEALILRADRQKKLEQLKQRLLRNAKVQEGEDPAETPQALLEELEATAASLELLIRRINRTNVQTPLATKAECLTDALARRDVLRLRHGIYTDLASAATVTQDRATKSEVKFKAAVRVRDVQAQADAIAQELRELDARIQEVNWKTELIT